MRIVDKYYNQDDDFIHPLWLGILLLLSVITIVGTLCCLRIKFGSKLLHLLNRLFCRNIETNDNNSNEDKYSTISYSYNWPSIYSSTKSPSPKLYTLVNSLRQANLQKQAAIIQQSSNENENEIEVDHLPQISISSSPNNTRNSEIARKFYASMRNNSQCRNSASIDSYNNVLSSFDAPIKSNHERHLNLFRTQQFFQSIPNQDSLVIDL